MLQFDPQKYTYPSRRSVVYGTRGMVCTSQPLAAQAGIDIMKRGGNAVDAAVAAAACMTVVEPVSNGLGSDAFAIVWMDGRMYGLNASGRNPLGLTADTVKGLGYDNVPIRGWIPVMVPGAPSAWAALNSRFGKLPLAEVLEPAARYAEEGYPVTPVISRMWKTCFDEFSENSKDRCFSGWFGTFAPDGRAPKAGEIWRSRDMAESIRLIGETNAEAFYRGELMEKTVRWSEETGGYLREEDLASYHPDWVDPISVRYHGYDVWEIPPNGAGIVALMTLGILDGFPAGYRDDFLTVHRQLEAMKLAYADGRRYVTDPAFMTVKPEELLSPAYLEARRGLIGTEAADPHPGDPRGSDTIYLCTADGEGNMVSFIQSGYNQFGSGIVVPGTGISLQDRGANFSLDPASANCMAPGKKTYHTILPSFLSKDGKPVGPFGVMGGFMQPQGHVQVVMNTVDFHMNPQTALDAPRWQWTGGKTFLLEKSFPEDLALELSAHGHDIRYTLLPDSFGRGQIIWRDENGVLCGGTEPRGDGTVAVW